MPVSYPKSYNFYAAFLDFVATKTDKSDVSVHAMMAELQTAAIQLRETETITLLASRAQLASRGFAGVAQFLQHRILPEAQAHGNENALWQIQWAIAASLQIGRALILKLDDLEPDALATSEVMLDMPPLDRIPGGHQNTTVH